MPLFDAWARTILNSAIGGTAFTPPATLFFGLSTTTPNTDGTNVTEPASGGYARASSTNNTTNWPADVSGTASKSNATVINFPQASATWSAGANFTHVCVYADPSGGANPLAFGALSTPKPVTSGDTASFAVSSVTWTLA